MTDHVHITHQLRRAQGENRYTLHLLHKIDKVEVYERRHHGRPLDVAVVRGPRTAHGATAPEALAKMREQLQAQAAAENKIFDWQTGRGAGFSEECLTAFCAANQLDPQGRITLRELRRRVMSNRQINYQAYAKALRVVGIILPPPPKHL